MKQIPLPSLLALMIAFLGLIGMDSQSQAARLSKTASVPKAGKIIRDCKSCPEMVVIASGSFGMGSPDAEEGRGDDEGPVHDVRVAAFALGKTEVTRRQFAEFAKESGYITGDKCWTLEKGSYAERKGNWREPGFPQNDRHPVTCISWNDADAYAKWLSNKTGKIYRLPTEAEWEYAARGNTETSRYWGDKPDKACRYANGADNTAQARISGARSWSIHHCTDGFAYTSPVGHFRPNRFGLYDMLGNVWEWTEDNYHDSYNGAPVVSAAWQGDGTKRVLRGGSWNNPPLDLRSAVRFGNRPDVRFSSFGFRVARSLK
ncbi:MAG TPA: formylglycine-generating enzyme family protein [Gallionella sp.]|nr:formylglycine-generating enzyme family protein [Gallionella sp.]